VNKNKQKVANKKDSNLPVQVHQKEKHSATIGLASHDDMRIEHRVRSPVIEKTCIIS
jgi:hypothetical protein